MGNYGSAHNLHLESVSSEMISNYHRKMNSSSSRYQRMTLQEESSHADWTKSLPSALTKKTNKEELAQYKVLPTDMKHGLKLRPTTNGEILQSGGTISGRKLDRLQAALEHPSQRDGHSGAFRRAHTMLELNSNTKALHDGTEEGSCKEIRRPRVHHRNSAGPILRGDEQNERASLKVPEALVSKVPAKMIKKRKAPAAPSSSAVATTPNGKFNKNPASLVVASDQARGQRNQGTEECSKPIQSYRSNIKSGYRQKVQPDSGVRRTTPLIKLPYRREKSFDELLLRTSDEFSTLKLQESKRISAVDSSSKAQPELPQLKSTFYFGMKLESGTKQTAILRQDDLRTAEGESDSPCAYTLVESQNIVETNQLQNGDNGILVRLRPTLPRRQLEIPSFSPFAAWRLLHKEERSLPRRNILAGSQNAISNGGETQIQLSNRTGVDGKRNTVTKSWTPQQDLGDDDDDDCKYNIAAISESMKASVRGKQKSSRGFGSPQRGHVLSLSLPRDRPMYSSVANKPSNTENFNSLQKPKGGPTQFGNANGGTGAVYDANNWVLHNSTKARLLAEEKLEKPTSFEQVLLTYFNPGKRFIYLPQEEDSPKSLDTANFDATSHQPEQHTKPRQRQNGRESLQDNFPLSNYVSDLPLNDHRETELERKPYTPFNRFSSTIRKLENKRCAQKLIKEAEIREAQRISELEAMKRVEEDFQKKRALEKADIREQLKVYLNDLAFDEHEAYEVPSAATRHQCDTNNNTTLQRVEPEGADCSIISMSSFNENYSRHNIISKYSKPIQISQKDKAIRMYP